MTGPCSINTREDINHKPMPHTPPHVLLLSIHHTQTTTATTTVGTSGIQVLLTATAVLAALMPSNPTLWPKDMEDSLSLANLHHFCTNPSPTLPSIDDFSTIICNKYPRCLVHRLKKFLHFAFSVVYSAHLRSEVLSSDWFPKAQERLPANSRIRKHIHPHYDLELRCAVYYGSRLDLTTFSLHILTLGRCIRGILDISFVFETRIAYGLGGWIPGLVF